MTQFDGTTSSLAECTAEALTDIHNILKRLTRLADQEAVFSSELNSIERISNILDPQLDPNPY